MRARAGWCDDDCIAPTRETSLGEDIW
jgi:hypothetical protein